MVLEKSFLSATLVFGSVCGLSAYALSESINGSSNPAAKAEIEACAASLKPYESQSQIIPEACKPVSSVIGIHEHKDAVSANNIYVLPSATMVRRLAINQESKTNSPASNAVIVEFGAMALALATKIALDKFGRFPSFKLEKA